MQKLKSTTLPDGSIQFGLAIVSANKAGNWVIPGGREITDRGIAVGIARRMHRLMCKE